jgi:N-acetyl-gamma-glutamylphosphate reductase
MSEKKIRVGLIGATGYGGVGLIERLINHPYVTIGALIEKQDVNKPISVTYPHLKGFCDVLVFDVGTSDSMIRIAMPLTLPGLGGQSSMLNRIFSPPLSMGCPNYIGRK